MIHFGQLSHGHSDQELLFGILGIAALVGGSWAVVQWVRRGPTRPDPWDESIASEIERAESAPLCHRCLTAHDASADFCPVCGATVGQYTNWLPYPYLFSVGHTLRIGTSGEFKRSSLTVFGFLLFSLAEYTLFAPVYWILMFCSLGKPREHTAPQGQSPPAGGAANI
jgi:hypothetical protein